MKTVRFPHKIIFDDVEKNIPCTYTALSTAPKDTSKQFYERTGIQYEIKVVRGMNSNREEYGIAFAANDTSNFGYLTTRKNLIDTNDQDRLFRVQFFQMDSAIEEKTIILHSPYKLASLGSPAINMANKEIFFTSRNATENFVMGDYDIYKGRLSDYVIEKTLQAEQSTKSNWEGQPTISSDGNTLYFVSDRAGGFGGTDIYVCKRDVFGFWSSPLNLGAAVNTPCDELTPFISNNGRTLYFSSSGHETAGGYDLFKSEVINGVAQKAENLGKPINTPFDELYPSAPAWANSDTLLYFSSNQTRFKDFDIFMFHCHREFLPRPVALDTLSKDVPETFLDKIDSTENSDNEIEKNIIDGVKKNQKKFNYKKNKKKEITRGAGDSTAYTYDIEFTPPNKIKVIKKTTIVPEVMTLRVNFAYKEFDSPFPFTLDSNGNATKQFWGDMFDNVASVLTPAIRSGKYKFEIIGHTDSIGSQAFNHELGLKRADFVRNELIKRGVPANDLITKSEGETKAFAPKPQELDEQYRLRLRRVEIIKKNK